MISTADLLDEHPDDALVCQLAFRQFGGVQEFSGPISTIRCFEDNVLLKARVAEPGLGRVLVVDGGGSLGSRSSATWSRGSRPRAAGSGVVVHGCVRDVAVLRHLPIGIKALGSNPRPSGKAGAGEIDVPVEFGGVTFRPGALLTSDDDGIVVLDAAD